VFNATRVRFRALRWKAHVWLARHPRLRDALHATGSLKGGQEAVARGIAIGLFIGLTPTVGIQTALMITACMLLAGNFPAAFAVSFVSNPLTMAPLYWAFHELGETVFTALPLLLTGPEGWHPQGLEDEIAFTILGSLLVATPASIGGYLLTHRISAILATRRLRRRQAQRRNQDENSPR